MTTLAHRPGLGRFVLVQAAVLLGVFVVLAITPAPVTFPDGPWEVVILLKGAAALLLTNLLIAGVAKETRGAVRTTATGSQSDALTEMRRLGHYHVEDSGLVVGVVDEAIGDRFGTPQGLIVSDGWFGSRRFLVPIREVRGVDDEERTIVLEPSREGSDTRSVT